VPFLGLLMYLSVYYLLAPSGSPPFWAISVTVIVSSVSELCLLSSLTTGTICIWIICLQHLQIVHTRLASDTWRTSAFTCAYITGWRAACQQ
jgi:hypothetical protein